MWFTATAALLFLFQAAPPGAFERGSKAIDEQKYTEAVPELESAIKQDPKNVHAHFYLAFALTMLDRDEPAIAAYRKALELQPDLAPAQLNLGMVLVRQKRPAEAIPLLDKAAQANPKELKIRLALADAYVASKDFASAEAQYRAALEVQPGSAAAEAGLGRALARAGKLAEAEPHYAKAAELDPAHTDALLELASFYEEAKQLKQAVLLYLRFAGNPIARERAGELLLEMGQAKEAIPHLEVAVASSPTSANRFALATAYISEKEYAKAEGVYNEALKTEPANVRLRMNYARVLREQKKYPEAAKEFFAVAQAQPDSAEAWSDLAGVLILSGDDQQALAALDKVRALGAEKAAHHYFRAIVLDKHKALQPALESYEKFLSASEGKNPDEEFKARQRVRIIRRELSK